ncbi:MAG: ribonuclease P protein component [Holdemanella porci]
MSFLPSSRIDNLLSRRLLFVIFKKRKLDHARVGISVGKKLGNAVCRNKVKRQLRSIVDDIFTFEEGYDLIIIVRPAYANKLFEENKNEMKENQNRINKRFLKK